jgi:polyribonucleotide nucleotidyltransferase
MDELPPTGGGRKEHMADEVRRVSVDIGGTEITFETGKLAKQAGGAVVVRAGDTMVLATATAGNIREVDFLPLTVDVEERMYAAGKIPGSFFKREGRAGEKGTLTARMIDRPIRPLFPKGWRRETQLVAIPMSIDHVNPYDILAMNGASAAIQLSDIPVEVPVGAVRVGMDEDGGFVLNPPEETLLDPKLDLVVAGTEEAILMVEAGAKEVSEAEILDALDIAHGAIKKLCAAQADLRQQAGKEKATVDVPQVDPQILQEVKDKFGDALTTATQVEDKLERQDATKRVEEEALEALAPQSPEGPTPEYTERRRAVQMAFDKLEKETIRQRIAVDKKRPDGRSADQIRDIMIEVGIAPRTHGSALFQRGQTQALSVAALGTTREEMRLDTLGLQTQKFYFHHYNFPPFSVGEAGRLGGPKRRDIGHGALAERALVPVVPSVEDFPYTIRVVSDILESNGSSSMASVCGSSLSLMQAGVPIKRPVAGIAMGLIKEGDEYIVLSDIAGVEDHLGDMDFKVAGTEQGITALQMDIKITGVTFDILRDALSQAKDGRTFILGKMAEVIEEPAEELSQYAPRISSIQIDVDQIGKVIGKGGETIRGLSEEFEAQIDVQDDGTIRIYAATGAQGDALVERIRGMTKEVEVGDEFAGKVVKTTTFGAFIELSKGTDGLLHISNASPGQRVESVEDVLNRGDEVNVRVVEVDKERGRIGLRLAEDPEIAGKTAEELASVGTGGGGGGGGRGGDRGGRGGRNGGGRDRDRGGRGGDRGGRGGDRGGERGGGSSHARDER